MSAYQQVARRQNKQIELKFVLCALVSYTYTAGHEFVIIVTSIIPIRKLMDNDPNKLIYCIV